MRLIAKYRGQIGEAIKADQTFSYPDYWGILNGLINEDFYSETNVYIATKMNLFIASELEGNLNKWHQYNIGIDELNKTVDKLEKKQIDLTNTDEYKITEERHSGLLDNMTQKIYGFIKNIRELGYGNLDSGGASK